MAPRRELNLRPGAETGCGQEVALCCLQSRGRGGLSDPQTSHLSFQPPHLHAAQRSAALGSGSGNQPALRNGRTRPGALPAIRMTARSAGSRTLPLPAEPPPLRRLRCVLPRFQGRVSPGLGEPLPPLEEPSSAAVRTSRSSPDMACGEGAGGVTLGGLHTDQHLLNLDTGPTPSTLSPGHGPAPRVPPHHTLTPTFSTHGWPHPLQLTPRTPHSDRSPALTSLRPGHH